MRSHVYEIRAGEWVRLVARPLIPVALFALLMHSGARFAWLPAPRPTLDVDRTVLVHKAEASHASHDAEILLLGDSSCLMNVSAVDLTRDLGRPVLNLGTLSYLDFSVNTLLLSNYAQANPGRLRTVVLLMHPEALRVAHPNEWQTRALLSFLNGSDFRPGHRISDLIGQLLGVNIFHGRILAQALPRPLPNAFGRRYGFTDDLEAYLVTNRGSAVDPESKQPTGDVEYRLAEHFRSAGADFRRTLPDGVKLFVAISPLPAEFAGPDYPARHISLLWEWSQWLAADAPLTNLPPVLPDGLFAQKTHLNETGQAVYTESLKKALQLLP